MEENDDKETTVKVLQIERSKRNKEGDSRWQSR